ncbi:hypothetical protein F4861DRAFT_517542 [Xylaria intraflava]|nr:hypothetical protein F4861DRAFT_517542 [Xylaria intraflava]
MTPFALSVPGYRLGVHQKKRVRHHDDRQEDAGSRSASPDFDSDTETQLSSTSRLPSESINPLSHSPNTLRQLALAGLSPEDELPSQLHPLFPHKPLPTRSSRKRRANRSASLGSGTVHSEDGSGLGTPTTGGKKVDELGQKEHVSRIRHLNTMTAVLHRCLRDGDIIRAKRAFGLLVQTKDIDVRIDNFWAIGSEILMRDGEKRITSKPKRSSARFQASEKTRATSSSRRGSSSDSDSDSDSFLADTTDEEATKPNLPPAPPQRWGRASNIAQVKTYLETLIQQHPYDAYRPKLTSALDFWPALFSIEIYNLDAEYRAALHKIHTDHFIPSRSPSPKREFDDEDDKMDLDSNASTDASDRDRGRYQPQDEEDKTQRALHNETDALRAATQQGALDLADRLDTVLETSPYSTHTELLRIRAHVSLFIADLYLPSRLTYRFDHKTGDHKHPVRRRAPHVADRLLRAHATTAKERVALARRGEEQASARGFFRRVEDARGTLEEWVRQFLEVEDG